MEHSVYSGPARNGTVCGTIIIFLTNISSGDLIKTVLLAAAGSAVSFVVSFFLKYALDRWKRKRTGNE